MFPVLADPDRMKDLVGVLTDHVKSLPQKPSAIVGLEARGFILGPLMAYELSLPFIPIRKKGKLPPPFESRTYKLEYGSDTFQVSKNALQRGSKVIVVDDLLATGGSLATAVELLESVGVSVTEAVVLIELLDLKGRQVLREKSVGVYSVVTY